ncbi:putative aldouronate transport system substrate-binding protein [Asanoa hainanensis]|uniref:Putative aldouronate transport system substrate-binding protein n=1 Tax=Asanoa hainanensis TaxID=560556 RepID=A0A239MZR1_9ACTN|nr:extracellular solute-binding protein [Asanoa hainanensis]SNT48201.1 putative aldouronate transport system substrate-binding protein [Asanoa hainanensis]
MFLRSRRRAVVAATSALAVMLGLVACSGDDSDPTEEISANRAGAMESYKVGDQFKATEPVSFSTLLLNNANYPAKKDWLFWDELKKRTNVTLEQVEVPGSDYNQKRSVLISAGDAPLIIPKTYHPDENAFVSSGAILPVSDYIDLMPNFKDKMEKWSLGPEIDAIRQSDGKYYLLPGLHEKAWQDYSLVVRTDVLQELGLSEPKTWDDVYAMLKAMKAKYPNLYPMTDRYSQPKPTGNLWNILGSSYGAPGGWGFNHAIWDASAGKYVYTAASDNWKEWVTFLNKLVSEKLLDPESFTQTDDQARSKIATDKSFVITGNAQALVNDYRPDLAKNPKAQMKKIPLPIGPAGEVNPSSRLENGVMISTKAKDNKNFVAMMQFIDWLFYSDTGQEFAKLGVEGTTFTKDASGKAQIVDDINVAGLHPKATKHLQKDFGFYNGVFAYGGNPELVQAFFSPEEQEYQKVLNARPRAPWVVPPPAPFTDEEREQATLWETTLRDYVDQQTLRFILGQRPLTDWDAYLGELRSKNMDQYMELQQKAYDRYKKEHG